MMMVTVVLEQLKAPVADENLYSQCFPKAPQSCPPTGPGVSANHFHCFFCAIESSVRYDHHHHCFHWMVDGYHLVFKPIFT